MNAAERKAVRRLVEQLAHTNGQLSIYVQPGDTATRALLNQNARFLRVVDCFEFQACATDADFCREVEVGLAPLVDTAAKI